MIGRVAGGPYAGAVMVSALPAAGGAVLLRVELPRRFTSMEAVLACLGHRLVLWRTGQYVSFSCVVIRWVRRRRFAAFCFVFARLVRLSHGAGPQGGTASSIMPRCESEKCYLVVTSERTTFVERRRPRRSPRGGRAVGRRAGKGPAERARGDSTADAVPLVGRGVSSVGSRRSLAARRQRPDEGVGQP